MIKIQSKVLTKTGKKVNWREVAFFANDNETAFEVREYYGQNKLAYMKECNRIPFDDFGVAVMNYKNIIHSREIDGYEVDESKGVSVAALPFQLFKPPKYKCDFSVPFAEQYTAISEPVVIPVKQGCRAYIKLGQESVSSIQAVDIQGRHYELNDDIKARIANITQLNQIECGVLEVYLLDNGSICLFDVIMLNGEEITTPYLKRINVLKTIFGTKHFSYPDTLTGEVDFKANPARHFIVKNNNKTCRSSNTVVVPNFYSVKVLIAEKFSFRPGYYSIMFSTDTGYTVFGELFHPHEELYANTQIQIAFKQTENGLPVNFWLSPIQAESKMLYDDEGTEIEQMSELEKYWYGV